MDLRGKTMLVVDDDWSSLVILRQTLKHLGCEVKEAWSVDEATRLIQAGGIDMVLSDLSMPMRNGLELIKTIRNDSALADMIVIAETAHVMVGDKEKTLEAGFDGFLGKPFLPSLLKEERETIFLEIELRKASQGQELDSA